MPWAAVAKVLQPRGAPAADPAHWRAGRREALVYDSGIAAGGALLDRPDRPSAIVGLSDVVALGVLDAMRERGLQAPRDVSVSGFDDIAAAAPAGLTTVRQPILAKGRMVGELLLDAEREPRQVLLPIELVPRGSTGRV